MKSFIVKVALWSLGLYCIAGMTSYAHAEESSPRFTLPPIVVTASRCPLTEAELSGTITIITAEDIAREQPADVVSLLSCVPGLNVEQPGSRGSLSSVYLRGSDANFTMVMIDGVKVNDPNDARGGSFDFSTIDLHSLERIEIIYGPSSAMYGSDAVAGVINFITREGVREQTIAVDAGLGTDAFYNGHVSISGSARELITYSLYAGIDDNGAQLEADSYHGRAGGGKIRFSPQPTNSLEAVFRYAESESESYPEDSGGQRYAVLPDVETRTTEDLIAGITYQQELWSKAQFAVIGSYFDRQFASDSPGIAPGPRDPYGVPANAIDSALTRWELTAQALITFSDIYQGAAGLAYQSEDAANDTLTYYGEEPLPGQFTLTRELLSPFLEMNVFATKALALQGGVRADLADDYDPVYSPKLGLIWNVTATTFTIKANWGKGFKLPSFFALGHPTVGNPDLEPERSESYDLQFAYLNLPAGLTSSLSVFHSRFKDLIDFEEGPPPRMVNVAEVTATGAEINLGFRIVSTLSGESYVTYTETNDVNSPDSLLNRPEWQAGLKLRYEFKPTLRFTVNSRYLGEREDSSIPTGRVTLEDYFRVDLGCTWTPSKTWLLGFLIDNLFDADYEDSIGFVAPGIRPRITATLKL